MPELLCSFPLLGLCRLVSGPGVSLDGEKLESALLSLETGLERLPDGPHEDTGADIDDPLLRTAAGELAAYLAGDRTAFSVPMAPRGTDFQRRVWRALRDIPYGAVRTYGDIAALTGSPGASRAVGGACHANPLPLFIPCHRVVAAGGKTGGYGLGLPLKLALLELERGD